MKDFQHIVKKFTGLDDEWFEEELTSKPHRFIIRRVRAEILDDDNWAGSIAVYVAEKSQLPTGVRTPQADPDLGFTPTVVRYDIVASPIDELEYIYFESQVPHNTNVELGSVFIGVQLDTDPVGGQNDTNATAVVSLDVEVLH